MKTTTITVNPTLWTILITIANVLASTAKITGRALISKPARHIYVRLLGLGMLVSMGICSYIIENGDFSGLEDWMNNCWPIVTILFVIGGFLGMLALVLGTMFGAMGFIMGMANDDINYGDDFTWLIPTLLIIGIWIVVGIIASLIGGLNPLEIYGKAFAGFFQVVGMLFSSPQG